MSRYCRAQGQVLSDMHTCASCDPKEVTVQGITVVDGPPDEPIILMSWGVMQQPVERQVTPTRALQIAADLINAALKREPRQPDVGREKEQ